MGKWGIDCDFDKNPALRIIATRDRWVKAKHDLEDAKYIEHLIHCDYVRTVRNAKTVWDYRIPMIKAARPEIGKTKKKERENLSYIENTVKECFFKDNDRINIKIHDIISGGYEGYYYELFFKVNKEEYAVQIPHREQLTIENMSYAYDGKFVFLHKTSDCSTSVEFMEYDEEEFAKKCKEYFDKVLANEKEKE